MKRCLRHQFLEFEGCVFGSGKGAGEDDEVLGLDVVGGQDSLGRVPGLILPFFVEGCVFAATQDAGFVGMGFPVANGDDGRAVSTEAVGPVEKLFGGLADYAAGV